MIQIDMQMPKNCIDCPACNEYLMCAIPRNGRGWGENDVKDFSQSRPEWCPMKEPQIVRCKDCKHGGLYCTEDTHGETLYECCLHGIDEIEVHKQGWFCADGERKENDDLL